MTLKTIQDRINEKSDEEFRKQLKEARTVFQNACSFGGIYIEITVAKTGTFDDEKQRPTIVLSLSALLAQVEKQVFKRFQLDYQNAAIRVFVRRMDDLTNELDELKGEIGV